MRRQPQGAAISITVQRLHIHQRQQTPPAETAAIGAGSDREPPTRAIYAFRPAREQDHRLVEAQEQAGRAFQRERLGASRRRTGSTRLEETATTRHLCTSYSTIRDRDCHPSTCTPTCLNRHGRGLGRVGQRGRAHRRCQPRRLYRMEAVFRRATQLAIFALVCGRKSRVSGWNKHPTGTASARLVVTAGQAISVNLQGIQMKMSACSWQFWRLTLAEYFVVTDTR